MYLTILCSCGKVIDTRDRSTFSSSYCSCCGKFHTMLKRFMTGGNYLCENKAKENKHSNQLKEG